MWSLVPPAPSLPTRSPLPHQAAETAAASPQSGRATPAGKAGAAVGGGVLLPGRSCGVSGAEEGWARPGGVGVAPSALEARGGAGGTSRVSRPRVPPAKPMEDPGVRGRRRRRPISALEAVLNASQPPPLPVPTSALVSAPPTPPHTPTHTHTSATRPVLAWKLSTWFHFIFSSLSLWPFNPVWPVLASGVSVLKPGG